MTKKFEVYGIGSLSRLDTLIRNKNYQAVSLYIAYAGVAEWQKTWRIKATTDFMAKRLGWSDRSIQKYKKVLLQHGLIEDSHDKNADGKITGHYILVHGVIGETGFKQTPPEKKPLGGVDQGVVSFRPSASPTKISASPTKESTCAFSEKDFEVFWQSYPRKTNKKKAREAFLKIKDLDLDYLIERVELHCQSEQWQTPKLIPHASTYLRGERWEDELEAAEDYQLDVLDFS